MQAGCAIERCGAKTRPGSPCKHEAGWGTDHGGQGRCRLHGGASPVKHGRYSTIRSAPIRDLIEKHEADPDPLNLLPDLAAMRALFQDYLDRYQEFTAALLAWHESFCGEHETPKPRHVLDLSAAGKLLAEATRIVERIERIHAQNAISQPELYRVMGEMARVVREYVSDPVAIEQIRDAWLEIRLQPNR